MTCRTVEDLVFTLLLTGKGTTPDLSKHTLCLSGADMGEHTHGHAYRYTHGESVRHAAEAEATSVNTQLPVGDKHRTGGWGGGVCACPACLASHLMNLPELPRGSLCKVQCFRTAWAPCPTLKGLFYLQEWSGKFSQSNLGCG